jgi:hypothetical protein
MTEYNSPNINYLNYLLRSMFVNGEQIGVKKQEDKSKWQASYFLTQTSVHIIERLLPSIFVIFNFIF